MILWRGTALALNEASNCSFVQLHLLSCKYSVESRNSCFILRDLLSHMACSALTAWQIQDRASRRRKCLLDCSGGFRADPVIGKLWGGHCLWHQPSICLDCNCLLPFVPFNHGYLVFFLLGFWLQKNYRCSILGKMELLESELKYFLISLLFT